MSGSHAKASHGRTRMAGAKYPAQIGTRRAFKNVTYVSREGCGVVPLGYPYQQQSKTPQKLPRKYNDGV
jgi:hypothetical protein